MEFEKKISPSVIDETLWRESEAQVSVKPELEVSSVLSYFEEQRDPVGKIKKKSKENYLSLLKVYWSYYLVPLSEDETALGIDGMALTPNEIFESLTITDDKVSNELKSLEDDALSKGLLNLQSVYQSLGTKTSINGLLPADFTRVLIDLSKYSGKETFMGISITPLIKENQAAEIFQKFNNYSKNIAELKNSIDKKNQIIENAINNKNSKIAEEIKTLENEYQKKIQDLTPLIEENKKKINADRDGEINHLKEERNKEINQTMNLIKESFKPIEGKVSFLNDLWEKDKNTVLNTGESDKLVSEVHESIDRFRTRIAEFDSELTNINMEINKIAERFNQIRQKYDHEEEIVNQKFDKQIQEENAKITALENERDGKVQARRNVEDKLQKENNRLNHLANTFKDKLDESLSNLNGYIVKDVELNKAVKLDIPIWLVKLSHMKGGSRYVVLPPVFLPRLLPKKITDDGLGQSEVPVKIYDEVFITHIRDMLIDFLQRDTKAMKQMDEDIGEQDYFKIKQVRNSFIDGIEMLKGRQLILDKSKDVIQTSILGAFKFSE